MDHARISLSLQNFNTATFRRKLFCPEKRVYSRPQPDFSHLSRHPFSLSLSLSLLFRDIFETRIGVSSRTTLSSIFSSKYFLSPRSSNRLRRLADENGRRVSKHRGMEKKFDARREIWSCKYCRHLGPPWKKAKPCGWVETGWWWWFPISTRFSGVCFRHGVRRFVTTCCVGTLMFQWKSIESMKRGDLLATTSDSALNPIIHLALSLSLSLLPPLYGALSTERRERERRTCVMWHVRAREKSKQRVRPLVRARERRRFSSPPPNAACNEVYLGVRVIKPLSWLSRRVLC